MFAEDLSVYSYDVRKPIPSVLMIGWIDERHPFPRGEIGDGALEKLRWLARHHPVNLTRGFHACPFCRAAGSGELPRDAISMQEVWIPRIGTGGFFAAPELVVHYIERHGYRPPDVFLAAVDAIDVDTFVVDVERECDALMTAHA